MPDSLSVVTMIHNRDNNRLSNLAASLCFQSNRPLKWILVDTGDGCRCDYYSTLYNTGIMFRYLHSPFSKFNKSRALNIGIKATGPESRYIMCTDADMMFGPNFIETVLAKLSHGNRFILCKAGYLPRDMKPFIAWELLCAVAAFKSKKMSPGAIQTAERGWWLKVHGYDEQFAGGLGGMDDDMRVRAQKDGLTIEWIEFDEAQALHQWHEPSPLKGKTSHLFSAEAPIVANLEGWGEW